MEINNIVTVTTLYIIMMDNILVTVTKFNDVIVTFCELSYPMHQCDNKFLLL